MPGQHHVVGIRLHHVQTLVVDIRVEEGRQTVAAGGHGLGVMGGVAHVGGLVGHAGEDGDGQAGGDVILAGGGHAHLAQKRVGQAEGHALLVEAPGGAGVRTGGGEGVAAVVVQHLLDGDVEPLGVQDLFALHVALHGVSDQVVGQSLHLLNILLGGVQGGPAREGVVLAGVPDVGLVQQLVEVHEGELGAQHVRHLLQIHEVAHVADGAGGAEPGRAEHPGLPEHFRHPEDLQEVHGLLPGAVGIALKAPGTHGGDEDGLHALGPGNGDDGLFGLLGEVDDQVGEPAHGAHQIDVHVVLALEHGVEDAGSHQEFLVPVDPDGLRHAEVGTGQILRDLLVGALDKLGIGHVVELPGELEVLAHAAGAFKYIVVVQRHKNGTDVQRYVFAEMNHNVLLLFLLIPDSIVPGNREKEKQSAVLFTKYSC